MKETETKFLDSLNKTFFEHDMAQCSSSIFNILCNFKLPPRFRILWENKILVIPQPSLPQNLSFWFFLELNAISPIPNKIIMQVGCIKIPNIMILCKQYFGLMNIFDSLFEPNKHGLQKSFFGNLGRKSSLRKQIFGCNLTHSPSNFFCLTLFYNFKVFPRSLIIL